MTYADRIPAPRPVPTTRQRLTDARACGHTPEQHRHDDGQAADAASHDRALRELTAELDRTRDERNERLTLAESSRLAKRYDQAAAERDEARAELGSAQELLAVVDDVTEQLDRARARYATRPEVTPVEPDQALREALAEDHAVDALDNDDDEAELDDALEHADSALIDRDDSVWRPGDGAYWTTRYLDPMTRDEIEAQFGPTRAVLLIDIEHDNEQDDTEAEAGLGSVSPHAQDGPTAADLLRQAAAGRREYASLMPEKAEPLDLQAHTLDAAARVVEGDLSPLYDWLPSWQWTGEMNARLHPAAAALNERTPRP